MRMRLKLLRVGRNLSQAEFGKLLGYSRNHYRQIENGVYGVSLKFLESLSRYLNITIDEAKELTKCDGKEQTQNDRKTH